VKDIETKQGKLDRELVYLLNKAKYYVPKPKVNETGTNYESRYSHPLCATRHEAHYCAVDRHFCTITRQENAGSLRK